MKNEKYSKIIKLSLPVMISFIAFQMLGVVDILMVGTLGKEAIAAVGIALTLFMFFSFPAEGMFDGVTILAAKAHGEKNYQELRTVMKHAILLAVIMGTAGMIFFIPMALVLRFMTNNEFVYNNAMIYLGISFLGIIPQLVLWAIFRFMMAVQKNKAIAVISNIIVVTNIIFDWLLIFGKMGFPKLGIPGSAIATLIAKLVGVVIVVVIYKNMKKIYFANTVSEKITKKMLDKVFSAGFPVMQTNLLEVSAWTFFVGVISRLGTAPMAAHEIGMKIKDIAYLPGSAIGIVAASLAANYKGSGESKKIGEYTFASMKLAICIMGGFGIIFLAIPEILVGFFTKDTEVVKTGITVLRIMAVYQITDAVFIVLRNTLNGLNDTKFVRNSVMLGSWGIMVPLSFLFTNLLHGGVGGAWIGLTLYVTVIGGVYLYRFKKMSAN